MITEDYVSFETAKLLKEKGFDEDIARVVNEEGEIDYLGSFQPSLAYLNHTWYRCPTIQMAMKWLRDVHNLIISFKFTIHGWICDITKIFRDSNGFIVNINHGIDDDAFTYYDECEKACDIAIKYCLENLI